MSSPASILESTFAAYEQAINSGVPEKTVEFYHPEGVLVHKGKNSTYGKDNLLSLFKSFEEMMGKNQSSVSDKVFEGSENHIFLKAKYATETEKIGSVKGTFSQIWKKEGGKWLIIYDIFDDSL